MLMPDSSNQAALNLQVHIPKHYFSKRSRLFVIPVLTDSDSIVAKYKPIVLDAPIYRRKMERNGYSTALLTHTILLHRELRIPK